MLPQLMPSPWLFISLLTFFAMYLVYLFFVNMTLKEYCSCNKMKITHLSPSW